MLILLIMIGFSTLQSDGTIKSEPSLFVMENQCKVSVGPRLVSSKYVANQGFGRAFFAVEQHVGNGDPKTEIAFYFYAFGDNSTFERIHTASSPISPLDRAKLYASSNNRINDKQDNAKQGTELEKFLSSLLSFPNYNSSSSNQKVFIVDKSTPKALVSGSMFNGAIVSSNGKQSTYRCEDKFFDQLTNYLIEHSTAFEKAELHCAVGERGSLRYSKDSGRIDLIFSDQWKDYTELLGTPNSSGHVILDSASLTLGHVVDETVSVGSGPQKIDIIEAIVIRNSQLAKKLDPLSNLIKPKK